MSNNEQRQMQPTGAEQQVQRQASDNQKIQSRHQMNNSGGRQRPMGGHRGPAGPVDKNALKNSKGTIKRLLSYFSEYKARTVLVIISIIISSVVGVVASVFIKTLIDDYISPLLLQSKADFSGLFRMLVVMGCLYVVGIIASLLYNRTMVVIAQGILKKIRDEMFAKMQRLPLKYFDTNSHGDIMSHYTNDADTLRQMLATSLPQVFASLLTIFAVFISMLCLSIGLTAAVVVFVFLIMKIMANLGGKSGKYFKAQQESLGDLNGYIEEMVNGQKVIKVFCHEEKTKETFDEKNKVLFKNMSLAHSYANILMPIMGNMGYLLYVLLAIVGGAAAIAGLTNYSLTGSGVLTLGTIAAFLQLSRSFIQPISQVSQQINSIVMALAGADRIFKLMDQQSETDEGKVTLANVEISDDGKITESPNYTGRWAWKKPRTGNTANAEENQKNDSEGNCGYEHMETCADAGEHEGNQKQEEAPADGTNSAADAGEHEGNQKQEEAPADTTNSAGEYEYVEVRGDVRFFNVDFGYTDEKTVLHDINLFAKPGHKIAFVGATGAGKTTITNLINRFYDIQKGSITYDGIDVKDIKKDDLRRSLGMVLQDVNLFTGTVMENLRFGNPEATDEECINAAKLANAHAFIDKQPKGYDTVLEGDGSGLSQGQRQLLSIARAAVENPPVMILDEATSSIDTRTESIVQRGMDSLMEGRTVFVIAHRLSTVQNANVIMVLEDGRIIERGTHQDLIAQKGKYYQLYTGAFELE